MSISEVTFPPLFSHSYQDSKVNISESEPDNIIWWRASIQMMLFEAAVDNSSARSRDIF